MDCIGLIVSDLLYQMDRIGWILSDRQYWLDRIGIGIWFARRNWILCAGWFSTGWMGRWWERGGMGGLNLVDSRMGAPSLALEWERQHWLLRSGGRQEAVTGTNCVGAARALSICVGATK